jgi:primosomal protein N'
VRGRGEERVEKAAEGLMRWLESLGLPEDVQCLGPAPSFHALKAGTTQWQVLIKGPAEPVGRALGALRDCKPPKSVAFIVDADPEELP